MAPGQKYTLRSASGDLTAAETTDAVSVQGINAAVYLNVTKLTTPDADDEVDFYIQTTYDGTNYVDLENVHYATADNGTTPTSVLIFGPPNVLAASTAAAATDGALGDDTKALMPLGSAMRIKTAVAGATAPTYAYNATVYFF